MSESAIKRNKKADPEDFYKTPGVAVHALMEDLYFSKVITEPACGDGAISKVLSKSYGKEVVSTDLVDRGYGGVKDFFKMKSVVGDIITNPPYSIATEFAEHALNICSSKVALLTRLQFLESKKRRALFDKHKPQQVLVFSKRISCCPKGTNAVAYCWVIWNNAYTPAYTHLDWIN